MSASPVFDKAIIAADTEFDRIGITNYSTLAIAARAVHVALHGTDHDAVAPALDKLDLALRKVPTVQGEDAPAVYRPALPPAADENGTATNAAFIAQRAETEEALAQTDAPQQPE
jgi:hypothetical protein